MKALFEKDDFTLEYIQSLIDNSAEETINLEFKAAAAFIPNPTKDAAAIKREIGKDVSAFANSDGGIIIYGLKEVNYHASEITWIDSTKYSKDWLQQVIEANISRPLTDIIIDQIQNPEEPLNKIYIVRIFPSPHLPHMAKDGKFYRRNNQGNVAMEEYLVRLLYNQAAKTSLEIMDFPILNLAELSPTPPIGNKPPFQHTLNIQIKNTGNSIEHHYKLEIHVSQGLVKGGIRDHINNFQPQRQENGRGVYFIPNKAPLFQNEINRVGLFEIEFDKVRYHYYENEKILLRLYYSNGVTEKEIAIKDLIQFNGLPLPKDSL